MGVKLWSPKEENNFSFVLRTPFVYLKIEKNIKVTNEKNLFYFHNLEALPILLSILFLSQKEGQITFGSFVKQRFIDVELKKKIKILIKQKIEIPLHILNQA